MSLLEEPINGSIFNGPYLLLHLTILSPFLCDLGDEYLVTRLKETLEGKRKVCLVGKSEELFGPNKNISVIEFENTPAMQELHKSIADGFSQFITFDSEQYPDYKPHVTHQGIRKLKVDERIFIDSISLVKLDNNSGQVVDTIQLE